MRNYLELVHDVLINGEQRQDRTGTGTLSVFGRVLEYDLQQGFPAVTTKRLFMKGVIVELLWFLSGETNIKRMLEENVHIWDEWMDEQGELGRVYGVQWRGWRKIDYTTTKLFADNGEQYRIEEPAAVEYIDQLQNAIDTIRNNPTDRRMLVLAWNPGELDEMALPPCHYAYQLYVREGKYIDIMVHQRSADVFLGLPFDLASYACLVHIIAKLTDKQPGRMVYTLGDTHIYSDHVEQMKEQVTRRPYPSPQLQLVTDNMSLDGFKLEDFQLYGYEHHPHIKGKVSV